jgi:hypothetical protein
VLLCFSLPVQAEAPNWQAHPLNAANLAGGVFPWNQSLSINREIQPAKMAGMTVGDFLLNLFFQ